MFAWGFVLYEERKICLFQDSVLYNGTIRENLDPDGQKSDKDLWDSLEEANLKDFVEGLTEKLEYNVGEGGDNLRFVTCYPFLKLSLMQTEGNDIYHKHQLLQIQF